MVLQKLHKKEKGNNSIRRYQKINDKFQELEKVHKTVIL